MSCCENVFSRVNGSNPDQRFLQIILMRNAYYACIHNNNNNRNKNEHIYQDSF